MMPTIYVYDYVHHQPLDGRCVEQVLLILQLVLQVEDLGRRVETERTGSGQQQLALQLMAVLLRPAVSVTGQRVDVAHQRLGRQRDTDRYVYVDADMFQPP